METMARRIQRWFRSLVGRGRPSGAARWLPVDGPENGYYNFRLMHFRADGDLVRYPDYIWSSAGYWAARGGLSVHLEEVADRHEGVLYSDILVLLNQEDRLRCQDQLVTPWEDQLQELVQDQLERLMDDRGWRLAVAQRPIRVQVVGDGEAAMGGRPVGLEEGEFATALLPNLYHGPVQTSRPVAEVFVRIPRDAGGRGGFKSVGTFYDDQLAFTIGRHWLDNGRLDELPASALYTLHRFPGRDAVNHRLNADLADAYQLLRTTSNQGESVVVQARDGDRAVMEVMLVLTEPAMEQPSLADGAVGQCGTLIPEDLAPMEGMTMMPEPDPDPAVILSRRGVLLQRPHFRGVMRGYRLDIGPDGSVVPLMPDPASRFRVEEDRVYLEPLRRDITLDGVPLQIGRRHRLTGPKHVIAFGNVTLTYRSMDRAKDPRWPYLGEVSIPAEPVELPMGAAYRVGRDRRKCEVSLPDRAVNENILWDPAVNRTGVIRTKSGEVPVESFTTDSIMVAGLHAEIDLRTDEAKVRALSRVCPVYLRSRDGAVVRLIAKEGATAQPLRLGDDLLVGNTVFRIIMPSGPPELIAGGGAPGAGGNQPVPTTQGASQEEPSDTNLASVEVSDHEETSPETAPPGEDRPPDPLPERVYGSLPRALRRRISLPELTLRYLSLSEGHTVVDS